MTKKELLESLVITEVKTSRHFNLSESDLSKTYGEGKWSVRQLLHHLADTELIFHTRLKKLIAEPKQVIWPSNQDDWDSTFAYADEPLGVKKQAYEIVRKLNYELVDKYYDRFKQKEFVHSEAGLRTLEEEFKRIALHNEKHLQHIETALSK